MDLTQILDAIKKHGITAIIVILYIRNESRLNVVEDKLYNCYTMRVINSSARKEAYVKEQNVGILPDTRKRTKRHIQA